LLIDKSPLTLSHIWRKEKEGNAFEFKTILNLKILPPLKKMSSTAAQGED